LKLNGLIPTKQGTSIATYINLPYPPARAFFEKDKTIQIEKEGPMTKHLWQVHAELLVF
jgi:hypothetical protein